jgi:hypothetical protein
MLPLLRRRLTVEPDAGKKDILHAFRDEDLAELEEVRYW